MDSRILIVDDSPTVGMTTAWILTHHGYQVKVAKDGLSALSALHTFAPDLVLLDIRLPHLDGYHLCEILRGKAGYQKMPIIMVSGLSSDDSIQRALDAGANQFLSKPVKDEKLLAAIKEYLAEPELSASELK